MKIHNLLLLAFLAFCAACGLAYGQAMTLSFNGTNYFFRWAKDGQYEFLPPTDNDLKTWRNMVSINLHPSATTGDKLAEVANKVVANYERAGKILRTASRPRNANRPAEHMIVAVLGTPEFLEAAFARSMLIDGAGVVAVYSHRVYGIAAGPEMSDWLKANGPKVEKAMMDWQRVPKAADLKRLPQSK